MAVVVARARPAVDEVDLRANDAGEVGLRRVHAGVDHRDDHVARAGPLPKPPEARLPEAPLVREEGVVGRRQAAQHVQDLVARRVHDERRGLELRLCAHDRRDRDDDRAQLRDALARDRSDAVKHLRLFRRPDVGAEADDDDVGDVLRMQRRALDRHGCLELRHGGRGRCPWGSRRGRRRGRRGRAACRFLRLGAAEQRAHCRVDAAEAGERGCRRGLQARRRCAAAEGRRQRCRQECSAGRGSRHRTFND